MAGKNIDQSKFKKRKLKRSKKEEERKYLIALCPHDVHFLAPVAISRPVFFVFFALSPSSIFFLSKFHHRDLQSHFLQ
jgi:hypothetical protein